MLYPWPRCSFAVCCFAEVFLKGFSQPEPGPDQGLASAAFFSLLLAPCVCFFPSTSREFIRVWSWGITTNETCTLGGTLSPGPHIGTNQSTRSYRTLSQARSPLTAIASPAFFSLLLSLSLSLAEGCNCNYYLPVGIACRKTAGTRRAKAWEPCSKADCFGV